MTIMRWVGALIAVMLPAVVLSGCLGAVDGRRPSGTGTVALTADVQTLAGSSEAGVADGPAGTARFNNPVNVALAPGGSVLVCDFDNSLVRRVTPGGVVSTVVRQAQFQRPFGITFTPNGNLFVQTDDNDSGDHGSTTGTVWRIDLATGAATVVARDLGRPRGLGALPDGRVVLSDVARHTVSLMDPSTGAVTPLAGADGQAGFQDGTGAAARFDRPYGVALLANGDIAVADQNNHRVRRITPGGVVTTYAGDGNSGFRDGDRLQAEFSFPQDVAADDGGNLSVSDTNNVRIRRVSADGAVTTVAGNGVRGFRDGPANQVEFFGQEGIDVSPDGSTLFVADGTGGREEPQDQLFHRVRAIHLLP